MVKLKIPDWLYNIYVDVYNLCVDIHNGLASVWNKFVHNQPEGCIIPIEMYNQQVADYNQHVDAWNRTIGVNGKSSADRDDSRD